MNGTRIAVPSLVLVASLLASPLAAQKTPAPAPKAAETPHEDAYVTEKGFSSRIFEAKHRDAGDLAAVVRPLGSGFRGAAVAPNREFQTITIRDFPENVASIEAALKRLDVRLRGVGDVELHLWVLVGSAEPGAGPFPEELKEAVAALKSTLSYKNYTLAGSFVQRARDGARGLSGEGVTEVGLAPNLKAPRAMQLEYRINQLSLEQSSSGATSIRLDGFNLALVGEGRAQLKTDATLREGEKVVLGTSTVRDRALVVVVSGRVIK